MCKCIKKTLKRWWKKLNWFDHQHLLTVVI